MRPIPGGEVELHDARATRRWSVTVSSFMLARHPITIAQHAAMTGESASDDRPDVPRVEVSWLDAVALCNRVSALAELSPCYTIADDVVHWDTRADGYRLPTEAEWEHACRAGTTTPRYGELDDIAWYVTNAGGRAQQVATKQPNAWGLHDMLGNVWEWCWDHLDPDVYGSYRVFRGGGWADDPWSCRASCRRGSHPTFRIDDLGLRLARNATR